MHRKFQLPDAWSRALAWYCQNYYQLQTVSRDSGYTTPSPMVGNVGAEDNQVCHNFCFLMCRDAVIKTNMQVLMWGGGDNFYLSCNKAE